jgi:hypothetical protein
VGDTLGVRYKAPGGGNNVYLGYSNLGTGGNRVDAPTTWPNGRRPFTFAFDGTVLTTTLPGATGVAAVNLSSASLSLPPRCPTPDRLELRVRAQGTATATEVTNLVVNGVALGGFGPVTFDTTDYFANDQYFTISGDFSGPFTITGLIITTGWSSGNESNQVQLAVGCSS